MSNDDRRVSNDHRRVSNDGKLVVLLRGVNVGGRNKVPMAELRALAGGLGYHAAKTHLNSGNLVCDPSGKPPQRVAESIEAAIAERLRLSISVLVRTAAELEAILAANPLRDAADNPSRLLVTFLSAPARAAALDDLDADTFAPDRYAAAGREIYVWAPNGVSETKLTWSFWEKRLGVTATARNWNTVTRLLQLARGD
ncbi:MAG: DUF1697 domain-containing protein [Solirubrobacteraceae bacterium]